MTLFGAKDVRLFLFSLSDPQPHPPSLLPSLPQHLTETSSTSPCPSTTLLEPSTLPLKLRLKLLLKPQLSFLLLPPLLLLPLQPPTTPSLPLPLPRPQPLLLNLLRLLKLLSFPTELTTSLTGKESLLEPLSEEELDRCLLREEDWEMDFTLSLPLFSSRE